MLFMSTVLKKKGKKEVQSSDLVTEYGGFCWEKQHSSIKPQGFCKNQEP